MTTKKDIKDNHGTCVYVATDFWECTDADGKVWWCDSDSCQPKPKMIGPLEDIQVHLDIRVMRDRKTGDVVVALPLATPHNKR